GPDASRAWPVPAGDREPCGVPRADAIRCAGGRTPAGAIRGDAGSSAADPATPARVVAVALRDPRARDAPERAAPVRARTRPHRPGSLAGPRARHAALRSRLAAGRPPAGRLHLA